MKVTEHNYYELLEVSPTAPQNEIHAAFQKAKKTYSSESPALYSMFSQEEAVQLIKLIEEAFSILGNQTLRKAYDEKLLLQKNRIPEAQRSEASDQSLFNQQLAFEENSSFQKGDELNQAIPEAEALPFEQVPEARKPPETVSLSAKPESQKTIDLFIADEIVRQGVFDGILFKKVREMRKISLNQLSDATRISRSYINAIEANDFSSLPAPVFVRGFIIQMARALKIEEKKASESFMRVFKDSRGK